MADHRMVLGIFPDEASADVAVKALMAWEKSENVVSRPVGVLVSDDTGQVKEHRLGARSGKAGAGVGLGARRDRATNACWWEWSAAASSATSSTVAWA